MRSQHMSTNEENSGLSCSYYEVLINKPHLYHKGKTPYIAECGEIIEALNMDWAEANIFKSIWRRAAERQGKKKAGNSQLRDAEKIYFAAQRMLAISQHEAENENSNS